MIRFGLAAGGLEAAIAAGANRRAAGVAFLLGALGGAVFVLTDVRGRVMPFSVPEPREEPWWATALRATLPSTVGLAVLAGVSLAFSPVLAAVLAGIIAGLGIAGLLTAVALRV